MLRGKTEAAEGVHLQTIPSVYRTSAISWYIVGEFQYYYYSNNNSMVTQNRLMNN